MCVRVLAVLATARHRLIGENKRDSCMLAGERAVCKHTISGAVDTWGDGPWYTNELRQRVEHAEKE
jgi:hypothetical protein